MGWLPTLLPTGICNHDFEFTRMPPDARWMHGRVCLKCERVEVRFRHHWTEIKEAERQYAARTARKDSAQAILDKLSGAKQVTA